MKDEKTTYAPLREVRPAGWLEAYLRRQADECTGHPEGFGYPFDTARWKNDDLINPELGESRSWIPYEQLGYWLDGAVRTAHFLNDAELIETTIDEIDYLLTHAAKDGYLGPKGLRRVEKTSWSAWPHAVLFRALIAYASAANREQEIAEVLRRHYLKGQPYLGHLRGICNIEPILWAYERTHDRALLDLARNTLEQWHNEFPDFDLTLTWMASDRAQWSHGVDFCEISKQAALLYEHTGERHLLDAVLNAYRKLDRDQLLADGVPATTEHLRYKEVWECHETCVVSDYLWSLGHLGRIAKDARMYDRIEKIAFNAAPGAVKKDDFRAHQYFSGINQVVLKSDSTQCLYRRGMPFQAYRSDHMPECCTGELHRIMPNFCSLQWMRTSSGGIVAALYAPGSIETQAGESGNTVQLTQKTAYPFEEAVEFHVQTERPTAFDLHLRIPEWCLNASVSVNGESVDMPCRPGSFMILNREFRDGDCVRLELPMEVSVSRWPDRTVAIERGPLLYALPIETEWKEVPSRKPTLWPSWEATPKSDWNYALAIDTKDARDALKIIGVRRHEQGDNPFCDGKAPVTLTVPARKIGSWTLETQRRIWAENWYPDKGFRRGFMEGAFQVTPFAPEPLSFYDALGELEEIELVPYGSTHLRMTVFPLAPAEEQIETSNLDLMRITEETNI